MLQYDCSRPYSDSERVALLKSIPKANLSGRTLSFALELVDNDAWILRLLKLSHDHKGVAGPEHGRTYEEMLASAWENAFKFTGTLKVLQRQRGERHRRPILRYT